MSNIITSSSNGKTMEERSKYGQIVVQNSKEADSEMEVLV